MFCSSDHNNGRVRLASPYGWDVTKLLKKEQKKHPHVWKHFGHDHFVIFSLIAARMVGMGTRTFFEKICQNCSGITVETSPFRISLLGVYIKTRKYWHAVPYPSSFHWCEGIEELPWAATTAAVTVGGGVAPVLSSGGSGDENRGTSSRSGSSGSDLQRPLFVVFMGSVDMKTPRSTQLRRQLFKDCRKHAGETSGGWVVQCSAVK